MTAPSAVASAPAAWVSDGFSVHSCRESFDVYSPPDAVLHVVHAMFWDPRRVMDGLPSLPSMTTTVGDLMQVTRVLDPASDAASFTLLDENGVVAPAERYLRYLADIERSPNTGARPRPRGLVHLPERSRM
ncbi:hypothetical protein [Rhodococcus jostii]|uniref:hypothetical protein n=1 Tax=Rhodococcus jostii TaxID=132919 RepID=UPI00364B4853